MKISIKFAVTSLAALLVASSTVYAAAKKVKIEVTYDNVKIVVNGKNVNFGKYTSGNTVEPFIYKGVTYLLVRAVSEALGNEVGWDNDTKTVYIGENSEKPQNENKNTENLQAQNMPDILRPYNSDYFETVDSKNNIGYEIAGIKGYSGYGMGKHQSRTGYGKFNLEGKYHHITGKLGADLVGMDKVGNAVSIKFFGDDKLIKEYNFQTGNLPIDVDLDVTGVKDFKIEFSYTGRNYDVIKFVDVKIK